MEELIYQASKVILYDMEISDVEERRAKALRFETVTKAASFLGMPSGELSNKLLYNARIENKRKGNSWYAYHSETKKKYAPRYLNK